jgi:hypothetical protein
MKINQQENKLQQPQEICPYLGLRNDPATFSAYPSSFNACYYVEPKAVPKLSHQEVYCLQPKHVECPIIKAPISQKMPKSFQLPSDGLSSKTKLWLRIGTGAFIVLIVLLAILLRNLWPPNGLNSGNPTGATLTQSAMVQETLNALSLQGANTPTNSLEGNGSEFFPLLTLQPTAAPSVTEVPPTATQINQPLALETPIGREYRFVIHRIQDGESILLYANWYGTSPNAIMAVNVDLTYPIQIGNLIVIPVDITDVTGIPAFEPYEVKGLQISVEELAEKLSVSFEDLIRYNNLATGYIIQPGEWVLVPREGSN